MSARLPFAAPSSDAALPASEQPESAAREAKLYARLKDRHLTMLTLCAAALLLAIALRFNGDGHLAAGGVSLPPVCGSRILFGVECPGCGLSRSFVALARGDVAASIRFHRVGWVMALLAATQIPYRLWRLHQLRTSLPTPQWTRWFGYAVIAMLVVNWAIPK